jgi:hypothetical protein
MQNLYFIFPDSNHKIHDLLSNHNKSITQLKIDGGFICTADNPSTDEYRNVSALGSLAELLKSVMTKGNYFVLFGDERCISGRKISIDSPLQDTMLVGHSRQDVSSSLCIFD